MTFEEKLISQLQADGLLPTEDGEIGAVGLIAAALNSDRSPGDPPLLLSLHYSGIAGPPLENTWQNEWQIDVMGQNAIDMTEQNFADRMATLFNSLRHVGVVQSVTRLPNAPDGGYIQANIVILDLGIL